jgi:hypothetical protein
MYVYSHCNIRLKQVKHLEHTLATYVYSHYNICNIQIKHMQRLDETGETLGTHTYNMILRNS